MAKKAWGVEREADTVLKVLERSSSWSSCVRPAWSWIAEDDVSRDVEWHDRWHRSEPWSPFAQESGFAAGYLAPNQARTAESGLRLWDRGAASAPLVHRRLWQLSRRGGDDAAARRMRERELAIDPWSPRLHNLHTSSS